jgi:hypothetical protein
MTKQEAKMDFLIRAQQKLDEIAELAENMGLTDELLMVCTVGIVKEKGGLFTIEAISRVEVDNENELNTVLDYLNKNYEGDDDDEDTLSIDFWLKN